MGLGVVKKLLVIGFTWPEPSSTAAGNRMVQLLLFFKKEGYQITFASSATESARSFDLESLDIDCVPILLNHTSFDRFVKELQPDTVIFDRFLTEEQFGWRVAECAPNALRILDTEDLHSLRLTREQAIKSGTGYSTNTWLEADITLREVASIYRSDLSLIISDMEIDLLRHSAKIDDSLVLHLPFMLPQLDENTIADWPDFERRDHFMCIGTGRHAPNVDAINWLRSEIWPLIRRQLPEAEVHIYGSYLPQQVLEMHRPAIGFYVMGAVADVEITMGKYKLNLAPLRFGAGIKGKLLDGMRYGLPGITTKIGAEGMHGALPWNGGIADQAGDFAKASVALYQNRSAWKSAQQHGVDLINSRYNAADLSKTLRQRITHIEANLKAHRTQNLIGRILQHQTLSGTKYLSKWIEEKNRDVEK